MLIRNTHVDFARTGPAIFRFYGGNLRRDPVCKIWREGKKIDVFLAGSRWVREGGRREEEGRGGEEERRGRERRGWEMKVEVREKEEKKGKGEKMEKMVRKRKKRR